MLRALANVRWLGAQHVGSGVASVTVKSYCFGRKQTVLSACRSIGVAFCIVHEKSKVRFHGAQSVWSRARLPPAVRVAIGLTAAAGISTTNFSKVEMEVTRDNFETTLPLVEAALRDCDYYAFDCEFTGLFTEDRQQLYLDDLDDRYKHSLSSSQSFLINQFGLSLFRQVAPASFEAQTFNFYLFPSPFENYDRRFLCQASSLAFLAEQGFDFNKFIRSGVPFMPLEMRDYKLAQMDVKRDRDEIVVRRQADKEFVEQLKKDVTEWLQGEETVLQLGDVNGYLRAVQYQQLEKDQFGCPEPPGFYVERVESGGRVALRLVRAGAEEVRAWGEMQRETRKEALDQAAGFSVLFELLGRSGKAGVGHNCGLDLAYSLANFVGDLPGSWQQYKEMLQHALPGGVYDTKYLANQLADASKLSTTLAELYTGLLLGGEAVGVVSEVMGEKGVQLPEGGLRMPHIRHAEGFERYKDVEVSRYSHEAGYDAFMCGAVFAALLPCYEAMYPSGELEEGESPSVLTPVHQFMGRQFVFRSDFPHASLYGTDPVPDRSQVFVVLDLPLGVRQSDLNGPLSKADLGSTRLTLPYGKGYAFLEVFEEDKRGGVLQALSGLEEWSYTVLPYADWKSGSRNIVSYLDLDEAGEEDENGTVENGELASSKKRQRVTL